MHAEIEYHGNDNDNDISVQPVVRPTLRYAH